jgi:hypothetical protein
MSVKHLVSLGKRFKIMVVLFTVCSMHVTRSSNVLNDRTLGIRLALASFSSTHFRKKKLVQVEHLRRTSFTCLTFTLFSCGLNSYPCAGMMRRSDIACLKVLPLQKRLGRDKKMLLRCASNEYEKVSYVRIADSVSST